MTDDGDGSVPNLADEVDPRDARIAELEQALASIRLEARLTPYSEASEIVHAVATWRASAYESARAKLLLRDILRALGDPPDGKEVETVRYLQARARVFGGPNGPSIDPYTAEGALVDVSASLDLPPETAIGTDLGCHVRALRRDLTRARAEIDRLRMLDHIRGGNIR